MFFFVNQYLLSSNSSIEHAEIKRLKLFKENHTPAKLVTRDFDPIIHSTLGRFGLENDQLVNMYDFFAGTIDYQGQLCHVEDLHLPHDYQVSDGSNSRTVKDGDRLVAEIFFIGGTVGLVDHVDYFDVAGNLTLRQRFDIRGFKAVDVFFGQDGQIHYERYYRPDGSNYLDQYYVQSTQNTPINSFNVLKGYNGKDYYFDGIDELFTFFLQELDNSNTDTNSFIADRPAIAIRPVLQLSQKTKKYLWLPFNHVDDGQDPLTGPLNGLINEPLTNELTKWDGIIVMTQHQHDELQKKIGNKVPIYVINGVPVKHTTKRVPMNKRQLHNIIYVGRLGNDKQISNLISIYTLVHKKIKDSKLTLYGYGSPNDTNTYKEQVKQAGLKNYVTFAGYQVKLAEAYDQAQLFVDTSRIDAQPLSMGEALSHGLPVVSYDYYYGPNELIKPGINGELINLGNEKKFAETIISLLKDQKELQKLSNGAYANIDVIDTNTTWAQWEKLIANNS